jgi:hypothetical protein
LPNYYCVCICKLCRCLASTISLSPLLAHIIRIVLVCSKKEMTRIYARWHIAVMKYVKTVWNRAIMYFPRNPMCLIHSLCFTVQPPVAKWAGTSAPQPATRVWFSHNIFLKPLFNWERGRTMLSVHRFIDY